jgi:hypothetical protein
MREAGSSGLYFSTTDPKGFFFPFALINSSALVIAAIERS